MADLEPSISPEFLKGVYHPEFIPKNLDLTDFVREVDSHEDVRRSLESKSLAVPVNTPKPGTANGTPIPLTEAEAAEADRQIQATLDRIRTTKAAIAAVRGDIHKFVHAGSVNGEEYRFKMDISNKRNIRRAIKQLFGYKTDTITYSMYQEMLEAKKLLETEQGEAYASGFPKKKNSKKNSNQDSGNRNSSSKDSKESQKGFLERGSKGEDPTGGEAQEEEQYMRMYMKMARDFVHRKDLDRQVDQLVGILDPLGKTPIASDNTEARKRALEYKAVLDSGKDGSKIYKDIIKLDDD